jgi:hypothetical protein
MAKYIQVGNDVIEFPDTMSDAEIERILSQQIKPDFTAPTTETYDSSAEAMASGIPYTGESTAIDRSAGGFLKGAIQDPITALRQIAGGQGTREQIAQQEAAYQEMRRQRGDTGFEGSRLAGAVFSPAGVVAPLRAAQAARTVGGGLLAQSAAAGATGAALQPTTGATDAAGFAEEKAQQIGLGGALGIGTYFVGKALTPQLKEGVNELIAQGIPLTPGQAYTGVPGWVFRQIESFDVPFYRVNKEKINQQFTKAIGNEVLSSLNAQVPKEAQSGQDVFKFVHETIRKAYDEATDNIGTVAAAPLTNDISKALEITKASFSNTRQAKAFENIINANVTKKIKNGTITGEDLKGIESYLRKAEKSVKGFDSDSDVKKTGFNEILKSIKSFIQDNDASGNVRKANEAWAKRARFKAAVQKTPETAGTVTPQQMLAEAARQGEGVQSALGTAPLQPQSAQAFNIVGETGGEATKYRNLLIASKVTGLGLYGIFQPQIAVPLMLASGISYDVANALMKSPALRNTLNQAVEKLGPSQVSRIVSQIQEQPE